MTCYIVGPKHLMVVSLLESELPEMLPTETPVTELQLMITRLRK